MEGRGLSQPLFINWRSAIKWEGGGHIMRCTNIRHSPIQTLLILIIYNQTTVIQYYMPHLISTPQFSNQQGGAIRDLRDGREPKNRGERKDKKNLQPDFIFRIGTMWWEGVVRQYEGGIMGNGSRGGVTTIFHPPPPLHPTIIPPPPSETQRTLPDGKEPQEEKE